MRSLPELPEQLLVAGLRLSDVGDRFGPERLVEPMVRGAATEGSAYGRRPVPQPDILWEGATAQPLATVAYRALAQVMTNVAVNSVPGDAARQATTITGQRCRQGRRKNLEIRENWRS